MKTVLVLGTHRSGTSLVAGMLHYLGVPMGPPGADDRWILPNWSNPTGQFENPEFTDLLHRFLDFDGEEPRWDPAWNDLGARTARFLPEFVRLVRRTESERWGWKQPWTLLILEALLPHLQNPRFVVVRRDLAQIVDSIHRRDGLGVGESEQVSGELLGRMERLLRAHPAIPSLTLEYSEVVRDPPTAVARLVEFVGIVPDTDAARRATGLVVRGPALRRVIRHRAAHDLATLPSRYGWLIAKDLREGSRFTARHLTRSLPRETYRILRAAV